MLGTNTLNMLKDMTIILMLLLRQHEQIIFQMKIQIFIKKSGSKKFKKKIKKVKDSDGDGLTDDEEIALGN